MKYIIAVADGASDWPLDELGGKTPLEAARTPVLDTLAQTGEVGACRTIPQGVAAGSDTAFLSILGFDPLRDYTGRAPLEAMALGVQLGPEDMALRVNFIQVEDGLIVSHSAGLDNEAGHILYEAIARDEACRAALKAANLELYEGASYRHCLVARGAKAAMEGLQTTPPHDVLGKPLADFMPKGPGSELLQPFIEEATRVMLNSKANQAFAWGQGSAPVVRLLQDEFHIKGAVITAVPLVAGVCACRGMTPITVEGATGELDTNYEGKAQATLEALKTHDLVLVHVEAPDECGHAGAVGDKIEAIRRFDQRLLKPILEGLTQPTRILIMADHATPIAIRTHAADPVPYLLWDSGCGENAPKDNRFTEKHAASGPAVGDGVTLLKRLLSCASFPSAV